MNIANQNPSNFLDINYLDLIKSPLQQIRKVYNFLNIENNTDIFNSEFFEPILSFLILLFLVIFVNCEESSIS